MKELVANAFEGVGGQGLIDDSGQSQAYKELMAKACSRVGGQSLFLVSDQSQM